LNYKESGVDIEAGNLLIEAIKPIAKRTHFDNVLGQLGGVIKR
jgi:phosphoribosylformylglycinamidine cyclo-ligase